MQVSDGSGRFGRAGWSRSGSPRPRGSAGEGGSDDMDQPDADPGAEESAGQSIRERQRRRRDEARIRADIEAVLAAPQDEDEAEEETPPSGPAPASVFVVFRGAQWHDPDGALRESDAIAGIYATEEAARRAAAALKQEATEREDAWYQPYAVQP